MSKSKDILNYSLAAAGLIIALTYLFNSTMRNDFKQDGNYYFDNRTGEEFRVIKTYK